MFLIYAAYFLAKLKKNFRYVLDIRDLWPQMVAGMGFLREEGRVYKWLYALSDKVYVDAEKIIGVEEGICRYIESVTGPGKVSMIYNPVNMGLVQPLDKEGIDRFKSEHPDLFGDPIQTTFLFSGTHARSMDLMTWMRAIQRVRETTTGFKVILIGQGEEKEELRAFVSKNRLDGSVTFLPFMEREKLIRYINAVDYCYSSLKNEPIFEYAIPTKVLEYLSCNKFVLAALDGPFIRKVEQEGNAWVTPRGDAEKTAEGMLELIKYRDRYVAQVTSRDFILTHFSREKFKRSMLSFFEELLDDIP